MNRIKNPSDQLQLFSQEVFETIRALMRDYKLTFDDACKVVDLAVNAMKNDTEWEKDIRDCSFRLSSSIDSISDALNNIAENWRLNK